MDIFITGIIGLALGLSIGFILGSRREAEKCHRMKRRFNFDGGSIGVDVFEFTIGEKGQINGMRVPSSFIEKNGALPKDFGKMEPVMRSESFGFAPAVKTPTAKAPEKKKRVSKPRTAAQRKQARDRMRIYRAKKKGSQK